jgi:hypothetical protein
MRRSPIFVLSAALCVFASTAAYAQVGGLIKKKVVAKATGTDTVAAAGKGGAKPKCDASMMVITPDVVSRYLKAFDARDAEIVRLSKKPGATGAYYAAYIKRRDVQRRRDEYDLRRGPDWTRAQAILKKMMAGDQSAAQEQAQLDKSLDPNQVTMPELSWDDQKAANDTLGVAMMGAGGFSACDWTDIGERIPWIVSTLVNDPNAKDFQGHGTEKDAVPIRPRVPELARALGIKYVSPADKARIKAADDSAATAGAAGVDPMGMCLAKAQQDFMQAHQAEMDAARKKGDNSSLLALINQMQEQANTKCMAPKD